MAHPGPPPAVAHGRLTPHQMAFGRDTAGVHFRRDEIEGIVLGELRAFSVMADVNAAYNEGFDGFR